MANKTPAHQGKSAVAPVTISIKPSFRFLVIFISLLIEVDCPRDHP